METKLGMLHCHIWSRRLHSSLCRDLLLWAAPLELLEEGGQAPAESNSSAPRESNFRQLFGLRSVHVLTIFAIIYIGIEVTVGGWIVTFIIRERGGGHASGYISSGFFGGEALCSDASGSCGSIKLVGEHAVIFLYSVIAIVLEITIWFVPSIIGNAVAVSLIGLAMGPCSPSWLDIGHRHGRLSRLALPDGTAVLQVRDCVLQPLMVSMMSAMLVVWAFVPRAVRRVD
ncbi:putative major facilitator superfamily protein [Lyophyllum shimeji]|uniref:Major facilitator superfamily protein n=1 Tax=Lyophyllum shimeji TaxID=47721 RepID=A0A9P3Q0U9_LYOSH|nr:putative major facilitator superfamily protein [Lyophyllum shimeji]